MKRPLMAMEDFNISNESISFQNGEFFKALTNEIQAIREKKLEIPFFIFIRGYKFKTVDFNDFYECIKKYTNLNVRLELGGPAIYLPTIEKNHIFHDNFTREYGEEIFDNFKHYGDVYKSLNKVGKVEDIGIVDLNKSKVSGLFALMNLRLLMPIQMFSLKSNLSSEETAAVVLHELGHAFTTMEFSSRYLTTNQALAGLTRSLDDTIPSNERKVIFSKNAELLKLTQEQRDAILNTKDEKIVTCIVAEASVKLSVSELGRSIYDVNSCEYLADQFATRHGAGKHLVIALDKIMGGGWGMSFGYAVTYFMFIKAFILAIMSSVPAIGFSLLLLELLVFAPSKESEIYDKPSARMNRIKQQLVEELKNKNLQDEYKHLILSSIETIDKLMSNYKLESTVYEKIFYYLSSKYRADDKYEKLQKDMELLGNNTLFTSSAKLSTI